MRKTTTVKIVYVWDKENEEWVPEGKTVTKDYDDTPEPDRIRKDQSTEEWLRQWYDPTGIARFDTQESKKFPRSDYEVWC
jgi:hypothetical protein